MLAATLGTSDEDLLFNHSLQIAQLGAQVPIVVSFTIAPIVLVLFHAYTLVRLDALRSNLRAFESDLALPYDGIRAHGR